MTLYDKIVEKHGKPKPILFTTENVRAIFDGRKTQTRRVIKWKPYQEEQEVDFEGAALDYYNMSKRDMEYVLYRRINGRWNQITKPEKPKYQPGDILYVRETFRPSNVFINNIRQYFYRATISGENKRIFNEKGWKWKPSIFMPKKIARLFLRVTDVRVERVQEISEKDVKAEGVNYKKKCLVSATMKPIGHCYMHKNKMFDKPQLAFKKLWNSINEKRGYGWEKNPYVWVVEFEILEVKE